MVTRFNASPLVFYDDGNHNPDIVPLLSFSPDILALKR
jgi:hypothetical protein